MLTLEEIKLFLRIDNDEEDAFISSLKITAENLVEDILRRKISEIEENHEPIKQAMLILIATFYEERQITNNPKTGVGIKDTLDLVRKMLFAYRKDKF